MKKILFLILMLGVVWGVKADDASWRQHPTFDEEVSHVVETPDYVYFTSRSLMANDKKENYFSLFRYDKKGDELMPLSTSNILNSTSVRDVVYNPSKGYLAVLYKDFDIDLLYNNGSVVNIPSYRQSSMTYPKNVTSMTVDGDNDRLYLSTDFGYVAINDKKYEIAESRLYGERLEGFCRLGDTFLAVKDSVLLSAPASSPRLSLDQYEVVDSIGDYGVLYPLNKSQALLITGKANPKMIRKVTKKGDTYSIENKVFGNFYNVENTPMGVLVAADNKLFMYKPDGSETVEVRPDGYYNAAAGTSNMSEIWVGKKRKGLTSLRKSGDKWSITRDWMRPNSPATFATTSYINHPSYGFLLLSHGEVPATGSLDTFSPMQLSGYKQGKWTNYAPAYTNPERLHVARATNGMLMDPDNRNYIYITTYHDGIVRLNLSNPYDIIHMAQATLSDSKNEGFVELPPVQNIVPNYWNITAPYFDGKGNMWMYCPNFNEVDSETPYFYCWEAADRRATTSANDIRLPEYIKFDIYFPRSNMAVSLPLQYSGNGLIVLAASKYDENILMIDTNGTPTDTSDDKYYPFNEIIDSDGNLVDVKYVKYMWEDPTTGYVWVCHENGVFYFVPSQVRQGNLQVYRLKVPRNDGTNLADYLLDGVAVNHVAPDSDGRKWFATAGGGVVCTSSDGREIHEEFTTSNSPLPDDVVYSTGFNQDTNSLIFSTAQGYMEYSLPVSSTATTKEDVRAYPNPVRPTYSGFVTITDIPQGSFVKIADAGGNLVKELGIMSGFEILWDLSDANFNRVKGGVYYILISPSDEYSKYSTVGKILVVS